MVGGRPVQGRPQGGQAGAGGIAGGEVPLLHTHPLARLDVEALDAGLDEGRQFGQGHGPAVQAAAGQIRDPGGMHVGIHQAGQDPAPAGVLDAGAGTDEGLHPGGVSHIDQLSGDYRQGLRRGAARILRGDPAVHQHEVGGTGGAGQGRSGQRQGRGQAGRQGEDVQETECHGSGSSAGRTPSVSKGWPLRRSGSVCYGSSRLETPDSHDGHCSAILSERRSGPRYRHRRAGGVRR